uniref:Uncharacterized protein n=1 Tax=Graphocephala atropunctata TaxID=36148 RepID=A0A1B6M470_9HEMI
MGNYISAFRKNGERNGNETTPENSVPVIVVVPEEVQANPGCADVEPPSEPQAVESPPASDEPTEASTSSPSRNSMQLQEDHSKTLKRKHAESGSEDDEEPSKHIKTS